jgi:hypothetical protein
MVDFRIHFIKANGKASAKVFKMKSVILKSNEKIQLKKKVSLANMSTRKHYPGIHKVDVILNGLTQYIGAFELVTKLGNDYGTSESRCNNA